MAWWDDDIGAPPKKAKPKPKEQVIKLDEREEKFLINLSEGMPWIQAGVDAGFSENYVRTCLYKNFWHGEIWQKRIAAFTKDFPQKRRQIAQMRLPRMVKIEDAALDKCEADPRLFLKHGGKLFDREYALAGLGTDDQIAPPSVNIEQMQIFMQQVVANSPGRLGKIPDAKQIEGHTDDIEIKDGDTDIEDKA